MKLFLHVLGKKLLGIFSENLFVKGEKETAANSHRSSCQFRIKEKQKNFALFVRTTEK